MKTLNTLIKLNTNKLDKIRKELEYAETEKTRLETKRKKIEEETEREIQEYSSSEFAYMLDRYSQNARKKIKRIEAEIFVIEPQIERLRSGLREQFAELTRFEIALEKKKNEEFDKIKKQDEKELDEFNTNKFIFDNQ